MEDANASHATTLIVDTAQICEDVWRAISTKLSDKYVQFPTTHAEVQAEIDMFASKTGYQQAVGAIDCSHVKIWPPSSTEYPDDYQNHKFFYSTVIQLIVGADGRVLDHYIGEAGRNNDCKVFQRSMIARALEEDNRTCGVAAEKHMPGMFTCSKVINGISVRPHLLADSVYPHKTFMQIQYPQTSRGYNIGMKWKQITYNWRHKVGRVVVENVFALIKQRWRMLLHTVELRKYSKLVDAVTSCVVLHNFCLKHGDIRARTPKVDPHSPSGALYHENPNRRRRNVQHRRASHTAQSMRDAMATDLHDRKRKHRKRKQR